MIGPKGGLRTQLGHVGNYLAGGVLAKALGLVSMPVMTRLLSVEDYGVVHLASAYVAVVAAVSTLGSTQGVARYYYDQREDFPQLLGTALSMSLALPAIALGLSLLVASRLSAYSGLPALALYWVAPLALVQIGRNLFDGVAKATQHSRLVAVLQVVATYASFGAAVAGALLLDAQRYRGVLAGQTLAGLGVLGFASFWLLQRSARPTRGTVVAHARYLLGYGLPLLPAMLSNVVLGQFDRVMIGAYSGPRDAGLYSLAYNIGALLVLFTASLRGAWAPLYYRHMNAGELSVVDREHARLLRLATAAAIALCAGARYLGQVLAVREFHGSFAVIPPIVLGHLGLAVAAVFQYPIGYSKRTYLSSLVVVGAGGLNIGLNAWAIPRYGYAAAAYTTLASYVAMAGGSYVAAARFSGCHTTSPSVLVRPLAVLAPFVAGLWGLGQLGLGWPLDLLARCVLAGVAVGLLLRADLMALWRRARSG